MHHFILAMRLKRLFILIFVINTVSILYFGNLYPILFKSSLEKDSFIRKEDMQDDGHNSANNTADTNENICQFPTIYNKLPLPPMPICNGKLFSKIEDGFLSFLEEEDCKEKYYNFDPKNTSNF